MKDVKFIILLAAIVVLALVNIVWLAVMEIRVSKFESKQQKILENGTASTRLYTEILPKLKEVKAFIEKKQESMDEVHLALFGIVKDIIKLEDRVVLLEKYTEPIAGNGFNLPSVTKEKPQYEFDARYKLLVPVELYPQVFEMDVNKVDSSVSASLHAGTEIIDKGAHVTIKDMKYCNRTQSWWIKVDTSIFDSGIPAWKRVPFRRGPTGWVNNDAFTEYPPIKFKSKKQTKAQ